MPPDACREGLDDLLKGRWIKVKQTKRRASKRASKVASDLLAPDTETENRDKEPAVNGFGNIESELEHSIARLLTDLKDKDEQTHIVVRGIVTRGKLAVGDIEWARECAGGPGVNSPTRVAVAELKKRAVVA